MRVLETLRRDAVTELGGVLSGFWSSIEEQVRLAALASHDFASAQEDRVAVMALSHRALELATKFRSAVEAEFDRWEQASGDDDDAKSKSLSLMSEGELEVHLAGQQITELLDHQFLHPLAQLDERLSALSESLGIRRGRSNPMRPEVAVSAFVALFGADDLTPSLRSMVFHQFDKRLPKVLGELYDKANKALDAASFGTQPSVRAQGSRAARPAQPSSLPPAQQANGGEWVPEGGVVQHVRSGDAAGVPLTQGYAPAGGHGVQESHATAQIRAQVVAEALSSGQPMRYRDLMREQLHAWRARAGGSLLGGQAADSGEVSPPHAAPFASHPRMSNAQVLGTSELLSVASLLQGEDPEPYARALAGQGERPLADVLRHRILSSLREIGFDPAKTHFSTDEEDAIDLIGILFQSLYEANDLVEQARDMYGRLVVPYLKVALTDDSLFNRRTHPARQLLDVLTEACDGNSGETPQDKETLERAEHAVDRVVDEYQDDQAIFELAAAELRDQLEQQKRRSELSEKRAAEAIHGRERLAQARRDADGLVASRLADRPMTAAVAHFLDRHWRHHLTQTWLRDGPDSARHLAAIGTGDAMVQVDADAADVRGVAVAQQLLALQVPLGECYSNCGMDATAARDAMARIISALALPDTPRKIHQPNPPDAEEVSQDASDDASSRLQLAGGTATLAFDPAIAARMRRLRVGQGLRLIDEDGHETACRIAWVSPLTSRFLIVNRRGVRKLVVSPEELASLVATGRVVLRAVDAPFDEAMRQLWQRLNAAPDGEGARKVS
ncbi:DUF1631 family protein [Luteimonas aestuarii]|uniref:DUF1631 family protein n=1 Tax=Luteimonas aestuarii TaxID=453837 RepID=UPI0014050AB5|nr:DUF1631 family protein [Luteimonas aestuarii]